MYEYLLNENQHLGSNIHQIFINGIKIPTLTKECIPQIPTPVDYYGETGSIVSETKSLRFNTITNQVPTYLAESMHNKQ